MKTTFKLLIVALVIFAASCKKESTQGPDSNSGTANNSAVASNSSINDANLINESLVLDPNVTLATENDEFSITDDGMGDDAEMGAKRPNAHPFCFIGCLKGLNLDSTQVKAIRGSIAQLENCKREAVKHIREINDSLIHRANAARRDLIQDYKDGKITKDQLKQGLEKIHHHIHELLAHHAERRMFIKAMINCFDHFKAELGKILTATQIADLKSCLSHC